MLSFTTGKEGTNRSPVPLEEMLHSWQHSPGLTERARSFTCLQYTMCHDTAVICGAQCTAEIHATEMHNEMSRRAASLAQSRFYERLFSHEICS